MLNFHLNHSAGPRYRTSTELSERTVFISDSPSTVDRRRYSLALATVERILWLDYPVPTGFSPAFFSARVLVLEERIIVVYSKAHRNQ